jgi:phage terminase large subunit
LCTREYQQSVAESCKKLLEDAITRMGYDDFYVSVANEIRGANGTRFRFLGLKHDPQKIKGAEGINICWIEEGETVSEDSLGYLIPTIREPGSEIWISFNPRLEKAPVWQRFIVPKKKPPDCFTKLVNYYDNPFFPDVLRQEMEYDKERNYDLYLHRWEGRILKISKATVFHDHWVEEAFEAPKDVRFYQGADWGFSKDPSVLVRCYLNEAKTKLYIDYEAWGIGVDYPELPILFSKVPDAKKTRTRADSARPDTISYMRKQGFNITKARKGKGSIEDGVERLKGWEIVVHPRCKHTISDLSFYKYKVDPKTKEILPILVDKNNDVIDSLRYATEDTGKRGVLI